VVPGTVQIREQVLRDEFAMFEGIAFAVVGRPDLPMQFAEMRDCVRNLVAGNGPIHSEELLL
jgi:hypothetical protein